MDVWVTVWRVAEAWVSEVSAAADVCSAGAWEVDEEELVALVVALDEDDELEEVDELEAVSVPDEVLLSVPVLEPVELASVPVVSYDCEDKV